MGASVFCKTKNRQRDVQWQLDAWGALKPASGGQEAKSLESFDFFYLKHSKIVIVKVKIQ